MRTGRCASSSLVLPPRHMRHACGLAPYAAPPQIPCAGGAEDPSASGGPLPPGTPASIVCQALLALLTTAAWLSPAWANSLRAVAARLPLPQPQLAELADAVVHASAHAAGAQQARLHARGRGQPGAEADWVVQGVNDAGLAAADVVAAGMEAIADMGRERLAEGGEGRAGGGFGGGPGGCDGGREAAGLGGGLAEGQELAAEMLPCVVRGLAQVVAALQAAAHTCAPGSWLHLQQLLQKPAGELTALQVRGVEGGGRQGQVALPLQ